MKDLSYKILANLELKDDAIIKNIFLNKDKEKDKTEDLFLMKLKEVYKECTP